MFSVCNTLYEPKHTGILGGIHTTVYTDQRQNCMRYTESSHVGYLKQQSTSSKSSLNNKMCTNQLSFSFPVLLSCVCSVLPSRSTVRRVAQVMNKVDRRKHDKFSNQFNYALNWPPASFICIQMTQDGLSSSVRLTKLLPLKKRQNFNLLMCTYGI